MKPLFTLVFLFFFGWTTTAQNTYFPPLNNNTNWDSISTSDLNWCSDSVASLLSYLDETNTKAFVILKDGKIALQHYFGTFQPDSIWYWASAGKTVVSYLIGVAQQQNLLNISDATNQYLGAGFTNCTPAQENAINIQHQLSMSTGLDDSGPDLDCLDPQCLTYLAAPGTRWSYHNAPYRLLQDVIESASGKGINVFTNQELKQKIGMQSGIWINRIFYSNALDMARFGLLFLNNGWWNGSQLLTDTSYFNQSINTSQPMNQSYGYLWWLNGKNSFMLPQTQFNFQGKLIPTAPDDLYAALGKNDQKIYVVPSQNMVVIRLGNEAIEGGFALTSFDTALWEKISGLACGSPSNVTNNFNKTNIALKVVQGEILVPTELNQLHYKIFTIYGALVQQGIANGNISLNSNVKGPMVIAFENGFAERVILF